MQISFQDQVIGDLTLLRLLFWQVSLHLVDDLVELLYQAVEFELRLSDEFEAEGGVEVAQALPNFGQFAISSAR